LTVLRDNSHVGNRQMKRVETDGLPTTDELVWVDCGNYRCLGRVDTNGKWVEHHSGEELKNVVGYYSLN